MGPAYRRAPDGRIFFVSFRFPPEKGVIKAIKSDDYHHCGVLPNNFLTTILDDFVRKRMGVATYRTKEEMPEKFRDALPDIDDLKKLL